MRRFDSGRLDGGDSLACIALAMFLGSRRSRLHKLLIGAAVVIGVFAVPVAASAYTSAGQAREALIRAQLAPRPLYPDELPSWLAVWNSASFTHGHFFVWKGQNSNPEWFNITYRCGCGGKWGPLVTAAFTRGPVSDIGKAINLSENVQGHHVRLVRFHGELRYRFHMDKWFGYMWRQQGFAYSVFVRYSRLVGWGLPRQFVRSLFPLGQLWTWQASPTQSIQLYRSDGGLDWSGLWQDNCADGSSYIAGNGYEDLIRIKRDGAFHDSWDSSWQQSKHVRLHETFSFNGRFPSSPAGMVDGSVDDQIRRVNHPDDASWNCGTRFSWQASPFSPTI